MSQAAGVPQVCPDCEWLGEVKTEPMTYQFYAFYINCLGWDKGFEDKLTSYCFC
jgi:hypothetical protein